MTVYPSFVADSVTAFIVFVANRSLYMLNSSLVNNAILKLRFKLKRRELMLGVYCSLSITSSTRLAGFLTDAFAVIEDKGYGSRGYPCNFRYLFDRCSPVHYVTCAAYDKSMYSLINYIFSFYSFNISRCIHVN